MVVEIALGIVLAVIILALLPLFIAAAGFLMVVGIGLAIVVAAIVNWRVTLGVLGGVLILLVAVGVPMALYDYCGRRWKQLRLLMDGKPPYDTIRRAPMRWATTLTAVLALVSIGVGLFAAGMAVFDYADRRIDKLIRQAQVADEPGAATKAVGPFRSRDTGGTLKPK